MLVQQGWHQFIAEVTEIWLQEAMQLEILVLALLIKTMVHLITMLLQITTTLPLTITDLLKELHQYMGLPVNIKEINQCLLYMLLIINLHIISTILSIIISKAVQFTLQILEIKARSHMEISIKSILVQVIDQEWMEVLLEDSPLFPQLKALSTVQLKLINRLMQTFS